jgi:hypothetical protein
MRMRSAGKISNCTTITAAAAATATTTTTTTTAAAAITTTATTTAKTMYYPTHLEGLSVRAYKPLPPLHETFIVLREDSNFDDVHNHVVIEGLHSLRERH